MPQHELDFSGSGEANPQGKYPVKQEKIEPENKALEDVRKLTHDSIFLQFPLYYEKIKNIDEKLKTVFAWVDKANTVDAKFETNEEFDEFKKKLLEAKEAYSEIGIETIDEVCQVKTFRKFFSRLQKDEKYVKSEPILKNAYVALESFMLKYQYICDNLDTFKARLNDAIKKYVR